MPPPNPVEYMCGEGRLVLRQEPAVMLGHHVRRVLDGVARLLVGPGLFQNMGREHVTVMRPGLRIHSIR